MPNSRSFWRDELIRFSPIIDIKSINQFERIKQYFNGNQTIVLRGQRGHNRLHKIEVLVNHLGQKFSTIALEQHHMKQYMPMKPHK